MIIVGLDLSKNHYALILKDTETAQFKVCFGWDSSSKVIKWQKKFLKYNIHHINKCENNIDAGLQLADFIRSDIVRFMVGIVGKFETKEVPVIIAIEGFSYMSNPLNVATLVEITHAVKQELYIMGCSMRIHDPLSVKLWAGSGSYKKEDMVKSALHHITIEPDFLQGKSNPGQDIADALFLLVMLDYEIKVRQDPTALNKLSSNQKQIFNRVSKFYPNNLLDRKFLAKVQPEI
jgi:hypothetical protein